MNGQVRTWKESEQVRGTHFLESTDGQTSQNMKRIQPSEGHSLPGEHRQTDKSRQGKNLTELGALTNWRAQMGRQFRRWKESNQARGTHQLESADRWTSQETQDMEKICIEQGALTDWRAQMDGQVKTWKESNQARGTH